MTSLDRQETSGALMLLMAPLTILLYAIVQTQRSPAITLWTITGGATTLLTLGSAILGTWEAISSREVAVRFLLPLLAVTILAAMFLREPRLPAAAQIIAALVFSCGAVPLVLLAMTSHTLRIKA